MTEVLAFLLFAQFPSQTYKVEIYPSGDSSVELYFTNKKSSEFVGRYNCPKTAKTSADCHNT